MYDAPARFTGRAEIYQRYRPSYPQALAQLFRHECGWKPQTLVCDIGAGTGIFSRLLLDWGYRVVAVEPNPDMRGVAEAQLAGRPGYSSATGTAEATGLPDSGLDGITVAQAFHWFDPMRARKEFRRILRPGALVALVWNQRREEAAFQQAYDQFMRAWGTDYDAVRHSRIPIEAIYGFFGPAGCRAASFPSAQQLDREGLLGRILSCSYIPAPESPTAPAMRQALDRLFDAHQQDGFVQLEYETRVYYGEISGG